MRRLLMILAALVALAPSPALAWWEYGHETVAQIAMKLVQPRTRASVEWLLRHQAALETPTCPVRTIEEASVWADCIKPLGDRFSYVFSWHYQDADVCKAFDVKESCTGGNCVSVQIARAQRMIADRTLPTRDRVMALAFLVHFVGDIHQPLHGAEREMDQGGNKLKVDYGFRKGTNIHSVWDGLLADRAISTPPGGPDGILAGVTPAERTEWAKGSVTDWGRESWELAKTAVYGTVVDKLCEPTPPGARPMSQETIQQLIPVVRAQVAKGGIRLARLLDEALDGDHPEVAHPPRKPRGES